MGETFEPHDYDYNTKLAEQFGFRYVACMICQHKDGHPNSASCQECINETEDSE